MVREAVNIVMDLGCACVLSIVHDHCDILCMQPAICASAATLHCKTARPSGSYYPSCYVVFGYSITTLVTRVVIF